MTKILKAEGKSVNGNDDYWSVLCPECEKYFEYTGYYDSGEITVCSCGCKFRTVKVWLDKDSYIC